jgi:hypothetical protein
MNCTHLSEILVFECDNFSTLFMSASVDASEAALSDECLSLVLIDDLFGVEVASLVVVVEDVAVSQVEHVVVVQHDALRRVHSRRRRPLVLQLRLNQVEQLVHALHVRTQQIQHRTRLSIVLPIFLDNKLRNMKP